MTASQDEPLAIRIGHATIGTDHPPFVIAEMSGNHNQSLDRALAIVDAAADAGAHAIKLQTYTADTMTLDLDHGEFLIDDPDSPWAGRTLYQLYQEAHTPWEWHAPILHRAAERGIIAFSAPFDDTAVDFLEELDTPAYKIASFENTDLPLIRRVAATGKPLIISTGLATIGEIDDAVQTARGVGASDIVLLQCSSTYPAPPDATNLRTIPHMREQFGTQVGLSDHTLGIGVATASVAFGATVIEKHFTLSRADGGVDAAFSLEPAEMRALVAETERSWRALGSIMYGPTEHESSSRQFRRSLYVVTDMKAGEILTRSNMRSIRPGGGLPPKDFEALLGKRVTRDVPRGTPVSLHLIGG